MGRGGRERSGGWGIAFNMSPGDPFGTGHWHGVWWVWEWRCTFSALVLVVLLAQKKTFCSQTVVMCLSMGGGSIGGWLQKKSTCHCFAPFTRAKVSSLQPSRRGGFNHKCQGYKYRVLQASFIPLKPPRTSSVLRAMVVNAVQCRRRHHRRVSGLGLPTTFSREGIFLVLLRPTR